MILYDEISSAVINNGFISEWFNPTRGCHQGCPYSPLNFNLIVEIIGAKIRQNKDIKGIRAFDQEFSGAQYADDC